MKLNTIKELIEKYFAGETSLEEEKILRDYFSSSNIDANLLKYQPLFRFFDKEKEVVFDANKLPELQDAEVKTLRPKFGILRGGQIWKIAAAVAFLVISSIAVFKVLAPQPILPVAAHKAKIIILDEGDNPEEALAKVNDALALVSKKMKKGKDQTTEGLGKLRRATSILRSDN